MDEHIELLHAIKCLYCPKIFSNCAVMNAHVKSVHAIKCPLMKWQLCHAKFLTNNDLDQHSNAHFVTYALSFYRSQNVLGWSKFFVPDQRFIYILWKSQKFCARQKDDLRSVKLVCVPAQKFLKGH